VSVAIIPITDPTVGQVAAGELEGEATELRLDFDCAEVTRAVAETLEGYCFARTTVLAVDGGVPGSTIDSFERERAWLDAARAEGADWILELSLRYDHEVYRENTSTFWLNYPLFLFAGPSNWFIPDNAYFADVELSAKIYDLNAIGAAGSGLGDPVAEVISVSSRFAGTELTFTERSGGALDYLKAIFIPSGHLARESEDTLETVHADILAALRVQLAQSLQGRRDDLIRMEQIAPIFLEPTDVRIARRSDGLQVQGSIRLRRDGLARRIRAVRLDAGGERVTIEPSLQPGQGAEGYDVFRFDVPVAAAADARYLRIECEAGSRDKFVRSFTFRIPGEERSVM
jgi:hypothetical protein